MSEENYAPPLLQEGVYFIPQPHTGVCVPTDKVGPLKSNMYGDIEIQACGGCRGYRIYIKKDGQRIAINGGWIEELEPELNQRILEALGWNEDQD